jgi:alpha-tubulin suppressor-like RCC1 family protein
VQTVSGGTNWKCIDNGNRATAGIKTDGTLWLWGLNENGQLGTNDVGIARSSPVQTISGGTNWKQVKIGSSFAGAITFTES